MIFWTGVGTNNPVSHKLSIPMNHCDAMVLNLFKFEMLTLHIQKYGSQLKPSPTGTVKFEVKSGRVLCFIFVRRIGLLI